MSAEGERRKTMKSDKGFNEWFKRQYGALPSPSFVSHLSEREKFLDHELNAVRNKIKYYDGIQNAYTAALYAWQAFAKPRRKP